jgi:uncharacterized membrane protein
MWETLNLFVKPFRFISLLLTGILAGILFDFWFFIAPALLTLPATQFIQFTQALDNRYFVPVPLIYQAVLISTTLVLLLMIREWRTPLWGLLALALVFATLGTISTLMYNVPINIMVINDWNAANPPADWAQVRDTWDAANTFRTAMFVLAFVCQIVAVLLPARLAVAAQQRAAFGRVQTAA